MGKFEMVSAALVLDTSSPTMLRWAYTSKRQGNCQAITSQANVRKGQLCVSAVGFSWYAARNVWRVRIRKPGRSSQVDIGSFKCMLDARAAYLRACLEVYHS